MEDRVKIVLLLFHPDRADSYDYLSKDTKNRYFILWHEKPNPNAKQLPGFIEHEYFWKQFTTPAVLLNEIKPDVILFGEIFDLKQIALMVEAGARNIRTAFLDHGASSDPNLAVFRHVTEHKRNLKNKLSTFVFRAFSILRNRLFYFSVTDRIERESRAAFLRLPNYMLRYSPYGALNKVYFKERIPDKFLIFSRNNRAELDYIYRIPEEKVLYTGIPFFDFLYESESKEEDYLVYIDHPYLEVGIFNWSADHHRKIAKELNDFAVKNKIKIYIKLHPRSEPEIWKKYNLDKDYIEVIKEGNYNELYKKAKVILGFSSTLMTGFLCAKKNLVILGWHPKPEIIGFDHSSLGLCHRSMDPTDLTKKFHEWTGNNLSKTNKAAYDKFIFDFNHPFDGKASERIIDFINAD